MAIEEMRDARELKDQKPRKLLCRLFKHKWDLGFEPVPYRKCLRCGLCITLPTSSLDAGKYWYEEVN